MISGLDRDCAIALVPRFGRPVEEVSQELPPLIVFQIPPDAAPANHVFCEASLTSTKKALVLPEIFPGPRSIKKYSVS